MKKVHIVYNNKIARSTKGRTKVAREKFIRENKNYMQGKCETACVEQNEKFPLAIIFIQNISLRSYGKVLWNLISQLRAIRRVFSEEWKTRVKSR